jgi:hypothetical protein
MRSATGDRTVLTTRDPTYPQIVIDHLPKIEALCKGRVRFEGETNRCRTRACWPGSSSRGIGSSSDSLLGKQDSNRRFR